MVTRRTLLKQGVYATLSAATASMVGRTVSAQSPSSGGFDFYISPTGSDSNPGTLDSPWAITALNTHRADYAGKRVGLLDGTYNCNELLKAVSGDEETALAVNGGPNASTPTIVAAVNARQAILTGADPTTGAYPISRGIIGQGYNQVANKGNVILDGLFITRAFGAAILFYPFVFPGQEGGVTGIVVRNCEIYDVGGSEANNPGAIKLVYCTGALISNNKIHSVQPNPPGINSAAIFSFLCRSNIYEYNTIFDCYQAIHDKNPRNGNHTYRYNYVELTGDHAVSALTDCVGGDAGDVVTVHNNVFSAPGAWYGLDSTLPTKQSLVFYNNTCYCRGKEGGIYYVAAGSLSSPPATVTFYNNIIYCEGAVGWGGAIRFSSGTVVRSDYNVFRAQASPRGMFGLTPPSAPRGTPTLYNLSDWQKLTGQDAHSVASEISAASIFAPTKGVDPASYTLQSSAVGRNLGRVGGVPTGAPTDVGAWGGGATRIGCDFAPMPRAPVLGVS